jgi:hypothetical protein
MDRFVNGNAKQLSRNSSNRWLRLCNRVYLTTYISPGAGGLV